MRKGTGLKGLSAKAFLAAFLILIIAALLSVSTAFAPLSADAGSAAVTTAWSATLDTEKVSPFALSPDGKRIALVVTNGLHVFDAENGTIISSTATMMEEEHAPVWKDNSNIIFVRDDPATIYMKNIDTGVTVAADTNEMAGDDTGKITSGPTAVYRGYPKNSFFVATEKGVFGFAVSYGYEGTGEARFLKTSHSYWGDNPASNPSMNVIAGPVATTETLPCSAVWEEIKHRCMQGPDYTHICRHYVDLYKGTCLKGVSLERKCDEYWAGGAMYGDLVNCNYGTAINYE